MNATWYAAGHLEQENPWTIKSSHSLAAKNIPTIEEGFHYEKRPLSQTMSRGSSW